MAEHTPAPWALGLYRFGAWEVRERPDEMSAVICSRSVYTHKAAESHANARLIAAAPELLAACKAVVASRAVKDVGDRIKAWEMALAMVLDAVEKAEGTMTEADPHA